MSEPTRGAPPDDPLRAQLVAHLETVQCVDAQLPRVRAIASMMCEMFAGGGTLYTFGNGGSAADAQHLTGELIGRFKRERRPLPAVTLSTDATVTTCVANDYAFEDVFSRQVQALARPGDLIAAFTTSGRSPNVVAGLEAARAAGATTLLFTGADGGPAADLADHVLRAPSTTTARIQETHTLFLHLLSDVIDRWAANTDLPADPDER